MKEKIEELLSKIGVPYKYYQFTEEDAVVPPFIIYRTPSSSNFIADNKVYLKITNLVIELYFSEKNEELETKTESVLDEENIVWEKSEETYIDNEKMYVVYYEFQL